MQNITWKLNMNPESDINVKSQRNFENYIKIWYEMFYENSTHVTSNNSFFSNIHENMVKI